MYFSAVIQLYRFLSIWPRLRVFFVTELQCCRPAAVPCIVSACIGGPVAACAALQHCSTAALQTYLAWDTAIKPKFSSEVWLEIFFVPAVSWLLLFTRCSPPMINDGSALGSGAAAGGRAGASQGRTLGRQQGRTGFLLEQDVLIVYFRIDSFISVIFFCWLLFLLSIVFTSTSENSLQLQTIDIQEPFPPLRCLDTPMAWLWQPVHRAAQCIAFPCNSFPIYTDFSPNV